MKTLATMHKSASQNRLDIDWKMDFAHAANVFKGPKMYDQSAQGHRKFDDNDFTPIVNIS